MSQLPLDPAQTPQTPRRGRPRGSGNKRSTDLAKYVAARFGGMTPGQQAAELCMISAAELRQVKPAAKALGVHPMVLAVAHRARVLAIELDCDRRDAMLLLVKAQAELLPYVHQKLPPAAETKPGARNLVISMPDAHAQPAPGGDLPLLMAVTGQTLDDAGLFDGVPEKVGSPKSDEPT